MPINLSFFFVLLYIWQTDAEARGVARKLQSWRSQHSVPEVSLLWTLVLNVRCFIYMLHICISKELVNLHISQGKRKGTDASCSSQGSTTGAVGEIVRVVWYFGQLDACHTIYWQHEYLSDY